MRLEKINLSSNKLTDEGAICLAHSLRYLKDTQRTYSEVNLSNNMIGPDGAYYLGE